MLNLFRKQFSEPTNALALPHGQFIVRDYIDASGQQFRLTFFVTIVGGEARGQLVSAQPIFVSARPRLAGNVSKASPCFCLSTSFKTETETTHLRTYSPVVSPFTELFFFTSQPTRAPSDK